MALVTSTYYTTVYIGEPIAADDFARYEARAEDQILGLTGLTAAQVAGLPSELLEAVRKAICSQMEYLWEYGITVATFGKSGSGFTVGKVSVQDGASGAAAAGARSMISPGAIAYLERTGLLNPSVATLGEPWLYGRWLV